MITGIKRICVGVADLPKGVEFFAETLNLPILLEIALRGVPTSWDMGFGVAGTRLAVLEETPGQPLSAPGKVTVLFETDDIQADHDALTEKGVVFVGPPAIEEWQGTVAYFQGPEGVMLGLLQPSQDQ